MFGEAPFARVSNVFVALVAIGISSAPCMSQSPCEQRVAGGELVFRAPFELRLQVDSQRSYEEQFDHVPFVAGDAVYLFAGEAFGVNVTISGNRLCRVTYQPDPAKADVDFRFTQEKSPVGSMMLVIHNHLNWKLRLHARMTVPGEKGVYETSVLPVASGHSNTESWPHPIVQLQLSNFGISVNRSE